MKDNKYNVKKDKKQSFNKTANYKKENDKKEEIIFEDQVEGRNSVIELLESGRDINKIFVAKGEKHGSINKILALAKEHKVIVTEVERSKINSMSQTNNNQGVIAIVPPFNYCEVDDILNLAKEKNEEHRFDLANMDLTKTNIFVNRAMSMMMPLMMFVMNSIMILIVWVGGHNVDEGIMQVGDMMAFIQYTMQIVMSFLMISMISIMLPRAAVSARRINEVLETEESIKDKEQIKKFDTNKKGLVEFKNVSFRYPDADTEILEDINFVAKPGETTALIGSTGSGKSTVVNLIPRFYDVTGGELLIDGVNIKDVPQKELRKRIGFVPQKGMLFSGTIESNIKYGNPDMSDEQMVKAAEIAQATEFIEAKEKKQ